MTRSSNPDCREERFDTDDVHHAREVVGGHVQRHFSRYRNKLATALANKLARVAWSILRNEKSFAAPRHEVMAI